MDGSVLEISLLEQLKKKTNLLLYTPVKGAKKNKEKYSFH
jgi:hypothetical protein